MDGPGVAWCVERWRRRRCAWPAGVCEGWGSGHARKRTVNMFVMSVTLVVSKVSGWLKAAAESNMKLMSVTRDVSKLSGWLKAAA